MSLNSQNKANIISLGTIERDFETPVSILKSQPIFAGNYDPAKTSVEENKIYEILSASHAGDTFGEGTQLARMAQYAFLSGFTGTLNMIALTTATSGQAAVKTLTFEGTATKAGTIVVRAGSYLDDENLIVGVPIGTTDEALAVLVAAAVNAVTTLPVTAVATTASVALTSKNVDVTGTALKITVNVNDSDPDAPEGITYSVADTTAGSGYADIDSALNIIGAEDSGWNTALITPYEDTIVLDKILALGGNPNDKTGMYNTIDYRPLNNFVVNTDDSYAGLTALAAKTSIRTDDCVNIICGAPNSPELGYEIASAVAGVISEQAQTDGKSAKAYINLSLSFLYGPLDKTKDWTTYVDSYETKSFDNRDYGTINGITSLMYKDNVLNIEDVVTPWSPENRKNPAFKFAVNIRKSWNLQASYLLYLDSSDIKGLSIVENSSAVDVDALDPNDIDDGLAVVTHAAYKERAWIYSEDFTFNNTQVVTSSSNPDRFEYIIPVILSGNYRQGDGNVQLTRDQSVVTLVLEV